MIKKCIKCGQPKEHHAREMCYNCYKKFGWSRTKQICKRCNREMPIHAKGLCAGCYNFVFHLDKTKERNHRKNHNIDITTYKKITEKCFICGFNEIVDLHHIDENRENNSESNLIGLCPNHHKMIHDFRYKKKVLEILKEKGKQIPEDVRLNYYEQS